VSVARRYAPQALRLAIVFVILVAAGWIAGELTEGWLTTFETPLLGWITSVRSPALTSWAEFLTTFGSGVVLVPCALAVSVLLYVRGRRQDAIVVAVTAVGALVLINLVKDLVDRTRPAILHLATTQTFSFPSGHAGNAMAVYAAVAYAVAKGRVRWMQVAIWVLAVLLILLVGWTRMYLGVHYLSDVVGAYILAGAWWIAVKRTFSRVTDH
jgi:membrane-associated phospholipid phosphatase